MRACPVSCCLTVRHTEEKMRGLLTVMVVAVMGLCEAKSRGAMSEEAARDWVRQYNLEAQTQRYSSVMADWNYNTNLTDYNQRRSVSVMIKTKIYQLGIMDNHMISL